MQEEAVNLLESPNLNIFKEEDWRELRRQYY